MKAIRAIIYCILAVMIIGCNTPVSDSLCQSVDQIPQTFPEYNDVTIPANIAPLNFKINEPGEEYQIVIASKNGTPLRLYSQNGTVDIPLSKWKKMLGENLGSELLFTVYVKKQDEWIRYNPIRVFVSDDKIDSHLAYRLINVGYILWNKLGLYQRDLTSFKESPVMLNRNTDGNCMNCHSFSQQNPEKMMFHMRSKFAGTVIVDGNDVKKISTKTPFTMAAAAYPSWHPDGKHIAFSVNLINQWFHGVEKRNEVYDRASDIVVYDIEKNTITTSPKVSTKNRETLPCWSPDGRYIYFCSTKPLSDKVAFDEEKYDLCRIAYNVENDMWGNVDTLLTAKEAGGSITFPKVSPDGKWLMFTKATYGYFTIFNASSDLYLLNLSTRKVIKFPFNSNEVDSYHSWSGNSRWIVFSSKRIDGLCTRPFFTHIDDNGNFTKPFVLPQKDPEFYLSFKNNYNVPELINGPVKISRTKLLNSARGKGIQAEFDKNVDVDGLSGASKIEQDVLH